MSPVLHGRRLVALLGLSLLAAACGTPGGQAPGGVGGGGTSATAAPPPRVSIDPADGATTVRPDQVVAVSASGGRLASVALARVADNVPVAGTLSGDGASWKATELLDPATRYRATATATGNSGGTTVTSAFTTVGESLHITSMRPDDGTTVGVGMPITLQLSAGVAEADQVEFVKHLTVSSTPPMLGAWHWWTLQELHFRPQAFWPAHATVKLTVHLHGVSAGNGRWGADEMTRSFTVGDKHVATVDNAAHQMSVTVNDQQTAVWPASLGKNGFSTIGGTLWVPFKLAKLKMSSCATFGGASCQPGSGNFYDEYVYWDTAVSVNGFYIHAAPWSVGDQGVRNVSHGCINLSPDHGKAFYDQSLPGDIVLVTNTARVADQGDGEGDWQTPWEKYANSGPGAA